MITTCLYCCREIEAETCKEIICGASHLACCEECFNNEFGTQEENERLKIGL